MAENPLVTIQIGAFYCYLMTNIGMITTFSFHMGLLQMDLHCFKMLT